MLTRLQNSVEKDDAVIIYFQNDHCAPCKVLRPKVIELLSDKYPKIKLHLVDPEKEMNCTSAFNVFSLPTILIFFQGKEFFRGGIYTSIQELDRTIERYYTMLF